MQALADENKKEQLTSYYERVALFNRLKTRWNDEKPMGGGKMVIVASTSELV